MTRTEMRKLRAAARRGRAQSIGGFRSPSEHMTENPNRGKRHAAPATARLHSETAQESERRREARKDYRPLKVRTVFAPGYKPRGRGFTTDGYTV